MPRSWSDYPVVDGAPEATSYRRLEDNTRILCLMWAAGPDWIVATLAEHVPEALALAHVTSSSPEAD